MPPGRKKRGVAADAIADQQPAQTVAVAAQPPQFVPQTPPRFNRGSGSGSNAGSTPSGSAPGSANRSGIMAFSGSAERNKEEKERFGSEEARRRRLYDKWGAQCTAFVKLPP